MRTRGTMKGRGDKTMKGIREQMATNEREEDERTGRWISRTPTATVVERREETMDERDRE